MRIGIDLLWVRPSICGGTESYVRNLLDGFEKYDTENAYVLFVSKDNAESFRHYEKAENMRLEVCNTNSAKQWKRILWENIHLDFLAKKKGIDKMFVPVYSMPLRSGIGKIPYLCVIHDLQALHYPNYFSRARRMFLRRTWNYVCHQADIVLTDSKYCAEDIAKHYPVAKHKIEVVPVPVVTKWSEYEFDKLAEQFGIEKGEYYYCVSSLLPHKNLYMILKLMAALKLKGDNRKLVLSGVGGVTDEEKQFQRTVEEVGIADRVITTGFISNEERDCLYENCKIFLFPSVFEGFGMPPIEAMRKGKKVVMTRETCLEEITKGKGVYVDDPNDVSQWVSKVEEALQMPEQIEEFEEYTRKGVVQNLVDLFHRES